jgi:hypothetical protein
MASKMTSIHDLPNEIVLKILSYFGPEDLCVMAEVCKKWNVLCKDEILWKTRTYKCDFSSDISRITKVRCTALLGFRTN